ncbi:MAG: site-specific DNA-methyltransferase [Lachnospiraceae bacterium]|nr:site-specific DNA-methyltransferase [Lachnospiraceae bacterium]
MNKPKFESLDLTAANVAKIADIFPGVVNEGKVNFDLLRSMLGEDVFGNEAYEFTWVGKRAAIAEAGRPIRKTLRPCVEESKNWDTTENLYIEGDNLDVLKLLQESYLGKVKMVYIDPPYNTGNDFIYRDYFKQSREEYAEEAGEYDEDGDRLFRNTESNGRFHSDWCNMIYPRLVLARNMLTPDGVIFISIDDGEVDNLRKIGDEIFGESNFVAEMIWQKKTGASDAENIATITEYVLAYAKNTSSLKLTKNTEAHDDKRYRFQDNYLEQRGKFYFDNLDRGTLGYIESLDYGVKTPDGTFAFPNGRTKQFNDGWRWKWGKAKLEWGLENGYIELKPSSDKECGWSVYYKIYMNVDNEGKKIVRSSPYKNLIQGILNTHAANETKALFSKTGLFSNPKPSELIKLFVKLGTADNDIILDFFSGSATTAHAVMQLNAEDGGNRKFIMVQLPELCAEGTEAAKAGYKNICEIGKERIRRAGDKIRYECNPNRPLGESITEDDILAGKTRIASGYGNSTTGRIVTADDAPSKDETFIDLQTGEREYKTYNIENPKDKYNFHPEQLDIGFRVLKLDDTNMNDVYYAAGDYTQDMLSMMESNIKPDRTDMDLLYGCLLDWGLPLSMPHTHEKIDGFTVHTYNNGDLIACFEEHISEKAIREIANRKPLRAVFRDSSFTSSPEKINVFEIFKLLAPNTNVRVI